MTLNGLQEFVAELSELPAVPPVLLGNLDVLLSRGHPAKTVVLAFSKSGGQVGEGEHAGCAVCVCLCVSISLCACL